MLGTWRLVTAPTEEPVTLAEAKAHLRVDGDHDDSRIRGLIVAARASQEEDLGRALVTQTWALDLEEFPAGEIRLPHAPVQSVTSVQYYDRSNVQQTWASSKYEKELEALPPMLRPADGYFYPETYPRTRAVTITYVAGYGAAAAVPRNLHAALLLRLEVLYRGGDGADALRTAIASLERNAKVWA